MTVYHLVTVVDSCCVPRSHVFSSPFIIFEEGLRLPAASSVKRIRVDTPIPIALHITSEPVPLFYNVSALGHHQVITMNTVEATQEQYIRRV